MQKKYIGIAAVAVISGLSWLSAQAAINLNAGSFKFSVPSFKQIFFKLDGDELNTEGVRLDGTGVYTSDPQAIFGPNGNVLKLQDPDSNVTKDKIVNSQIANNSITSIHIKTGTITTNNFGVLEVNNTNIANTTITINKFDPSVVFPTGGQYYYTNNVCLGNTAIVSINAGTVTCATLGTGGTGGGSTFPPCADGETLIMSGAGRECGGLLLSLPSAGGDDLWAKQSALSNNIYNKNLTGKVGVAITNPQEKLQTKQVFRVDNGGAAGQVFCYATNSWVDGSTYNPSTCAGCQAGYVYNTTSTMCERVVCEPVSVDGACGPSNGGTFSIPPTTNLCNGGAASAVTGNSTMRTWNCLGVGTGISVACSANKGGGNPCTQWDCNIGFTLTGDTDGDGIPNCIHPGTGAYERYECNFIDSNNTGSPTQTGVQGASVGGVPSYLQNCGCDTNPSSWNCTSSTYSPVIGGRVPVYAFTYTGSGPFPYLSCVDTTGGPGSDTGVVFKGTCTFLGYGGTGSSSTGGNAIGVNASCGGTGSTNGLCGSANGTTSAYPPTTNLCNAGTPTSVSGSGSGTWVWDCTGLSGGTTDSCSTLPTNTPVNGACGSGNLATYPAGVTPPNGDLCAVGTYSSPILLGISRSWSCFGANGGSDAYCNATASPEGNNDARCGGADGGTFSNASQVNTAGLCTSPSTASIPYAYGSGPWTWHCYNGSGKVDCSANTDQGVCGTADGGIYSGAVRANSAGLCDAGVAIPSTLSDPGPRGWMCQGSAGGVVACNATYSNCMMEPHPDMICNDDIEPVCGCDGNTYINQCHADRAGVSTTTPGECVPQGGECGNGIVNAGEQCDDGNSINTDSCDNSCHLTIQPPTLGCDQSAEIVTYILSDDDNFDPTMKLQPGFQPTPNYTQFIYNFMTHGGTIPSQTQGNFDTNNYDAYYLAEGVIPLEIPGKHGAPEPKRLTCIGFEVKAKEVGGQLETDGLSLMTRDSTPLNPNPWGGVYSRTGLASYFDQTCSMNSSLFVPYVGAGVPFSLNLTACPTPFVSSILAGKNHLYLRGNDDHNPDYVKIYAGYQ